MSRIAFLLLVFALAGTTCEPSPLSDGMPTNADCTGCHGREGDKAPPMAVNGSWSTETVGVGAHQAHLRGSALAGPVSCYECHVLPLVANGTDHPDPLGRPASVDFGDLSKHDDAYPVWDRDTRTCSGTFCHGSTLRGGRDRPAPIWTRVDGSQLHCDSCHGNPPGGSHPQDDRCEVCHGEVVSAGGVVIQPFLHVNGAVDVSLQP